MVTAGDIDVRCGVSHTAERGILSGGADPGGKARRHVIRPAQVGDIEQVADAFLADLEEQVVAEESGADRTEVGVVLVQGRPVGRRKVAHDGQRGGELEDRFAVVVGAGAAGVAAGDVKVVGRVHRGTRPHHY